MNWSISHSIVCNANIYLKSFECDRMGGDCKHLRNHHILLFPLSNNFCADGVLEKMSTILFVGMKKKCIQNHQKNEAFSVKVKRASIDMVAKMKLHNVTA